MNSNSKKMMAVAISVLVVAFFFGAGFLNQFNLFNSSDTANIVTSTNKVEDYGLRNITVPTDQLEAITESGLLISDVREGDGEVIQSGRQIAVHYVGRFLDGREFDSSIERNSPLIFTIGTGQVILGWDLGIVGMKAGGIRRLVIPASLAYGDTGIKDAEGNYVIPSSATLIFDVYLVGVGK